MVASNCVTQEGFISTMVICICRNEALCLCLWPLLSECQQEEVEVNAMKALHLAQKYIWFGDFFLVNADTSRYF